MEGDNTDPSQRFHVLSWDERLSVGSVIRSKLSKPFSGVIQVNVLIEETDGHRDTYEELKAFVWNAIREVNSHRTQILQ
jgi:hypothetical protein